MGEGLMASTVNSTTLRAQDMIVRPNPVETGEEESYEDSGGRFCF